MCGILDALSSCLCCAEQEAPKTQQPTKQEPKVRHTNLHSMDAGDLKVTFKEILDKTPPQTARTINASKATNTSSVTITTTTIFVNHKANV